MRISLIFLEKYILITMEGHRYLELKRYFRIVNHILLVCIQLEINESLKRVSFQYNIEKKFTFLISD